MNQGLCQKIALMNLSAVLHKLENAAFIPAIFEILTKNILARGSDLLWPRFGPTVCSQTLYITRNQTNLYSYSQYIHLCILSFFFYYENVYIQKIFLHLRRSFRRPHNSVIYSSHNPQISKIFTTHVTRVRLQ